VALRPGDRRTIQVDHDPARLGRRTALDLAVHGDVGATLRAILPLLGQKTDRSFLDRMLRKHETALEQFNNSSLGMVKLEMLVDGLPDHQTDHAPVDYSAIAAAAGIRSLRVEQPVDVEPALREALAHPGPVLVDLVTDPNALSIPPHITASQVRGFALAAGRIVLDGGVGRTVELARANVRNIPRPSLATSSGDRSQRA
jgi:thiamine pyrophosphate-dependent acetolactate synthase large subunit-like protein